MTHRKPKSILLALMLAATVTTLPAAAQQAPTDEMAAAAKAFLGGLAPRAGDAAFAFTDDERFDWHYTPRRREGMKIGDMIQRQRNDAKTLMRSTLSARGILKAEAIMALEAILAEIEGSSLSYRDPEKYFISVFGTPGAYPWGWRLEGHHLSVNVTVAAKGEVKFVWSGVLAMTASQFTEASKLVLMQLLLVKTGTQLRKMISPKKVEIKNLKKCVSDHENQSRSKGARK